MKFTKKLRQVLLKVEWNSLKNWVKNFLKNWMKFSWKLNENLYEFSKNFQSVHKISSGLVRKLSSKFEALCTCLEEKQEEMITYHNNRYRFNHCMFKWTTFSLRLCNYSRLGPKSWTRPTFATSQQLVAASMRMCDLYRVFQKKR